jgi:hypothetical protein
LSSGWFGGLFFSYFGLFKKLISYGTEDKANEYYIQFQISLISYTINRNINYINYLSIIKKLAVIKKKNIKKTLASMNPTL